jgi:hypothetical protein
MMFVANIPAAVHAHDFMAGANAGILIGTVAVIVGFVLIAALAIMSERRRDRRRHRSRLGSRGRSR